MRILYIQKCTVLIILCILIANSCVLNKGVSDNEYCYDVESLKGSFNHMVDILDIPLSKELEYNTKNFDEIKTVLGEPIEEYLDTFKYGRHVEWRTTDLSLDSYYDYFPDTLWKIPQLIIHKCVWGKDNKDIILFFANDCNNGEQPFWGYVIAYDDFYTPLRLLPEKNLTVDEVINKMGKPNRSDYVDTVYYGVNYPLFGDIYELRNVPKASIHTYCWYVGGSHTLMLIYWENEEKSKNKPIWGMLCHNIYFDAE